MEQVERKKAGRKSNMEKNGYWIWLQNVLVAHLTAGEGQVKIDEPVVAYCRRGNILISLVALGVTFGKQGHEHFTRWFNCTSDRDSLTKCTIDTDFAVHDEIYDFLVQHELIELLPTEGFTFAGGVRARRQLQANQKEFRAYKARNADLSVMARTSMWARSLRNAPLELMEP